MSPIQAQTRNSTRPCDRNNVLEHCATYALSSRGLGGVHRFHLTMILRKLLQCTHCNKNFAIPHGPKSHVARSQTIEVQGVRTAWPAVFLGVGDDLVGARQQIRAYVGDLASPEFPWLGQTLSEGPKVAQGCRVSDATGSSAIWGTPDVLPT
jgi:hypothetical protein